MPSLIPVTVSIWPISVSAGRLESLRTILDSAERSRIEKMRTDSARELIVSHGVARERLGALCGIPPEAVVFRTEARGKPHLEGISVPVAFNLSHSGGYCALATGAVARLGVDIEALRPAIDDLATNVFSERELGLYAGIVPGDRTRAFFRSWVAKEAYLKAIGDGLAGGLQSLETEPTADAAIRPLGIGGDAGVLRSWQFEGFDVSEGIVGAVAVDAGGAAIDIRIRHIDPELPARADP
ncbi:MAG: hypothetical protein ABS54_09500 [Hyphomicrobium sp. SCN 65-11]|nr:MAG: hypothetical protein ABS54_09500 [Hyphomicrobium sp. SCN 65-11]